MPSSFHSAQQSHEVQQYAEHSIFCPAIFLSDFHESIDPELGNYQKFQQLESGTVPNRIGKVYLVGAGPGDPRLLTLRGLECLQKADYVLYDGLVNPKLLEFCPKASLVCVGKHGKSPIWDQPAINSELVRLALEGNCVARLKGGDPAVFARTAEELDALEANRIPFEVIPGITAALAVAGYAGIPLTHRDHSSAVALVTGQQQADAPDDIDWESLARFPGTLSIYMGVTTAKDWTSQLIQAGKPADTPAAIVRKCSWNDQQVIHCRLDEVTTHLTPASKLRPPVLVVVGRVAHLGRRWNWFEKLPLFGYGIWLPRAAHQSLELNQKLTELGAEVFVEPAIQIARPSDTSDLKNAVELLVLKQVHGITFSSSNGVDGLLEYLFEQGHDSRILAGVKLATVGPVTAQRLQRFGLRSDIVPQADYSAESLLHEFKDDLNGQHWLVTTTNRGLPTLSSGIRDLGAMVTECMSYESLSQEVPGPQLAQGLESDKVNIAIITSRFLGEAALKLLGSKSSDVRPIALSDSVAQALESLAWPAVGVAKSNDSSALIEAVLDFVQSTGESLESTSNDAQ